MDVALVILTGALVLTTIVYAWFTAAMAREMRATRLLSVRPRLALDVAILGPTNGMVAVRSLGPGAAVDVRVALTFEPSGERRAFVAPLLVPGQSHEFFITGASGESVFDFERLSAEGVVVGLVGTMRDVDGAEHEVDERLGVADWWNVTKEAGRRYETPAEERVVRELEKIRKTLEALEKRARRT